MPNKASCCALALGLACSLAQGEPVPSVPSRVMSKAGAAMTQAAEVEMKPGSSVIIPIAFGHLNRIVTPFTPPKVHTVSDAQVQVDGSVIYVATNSPKAFTLFITPKDSESPALPVILAPRQIPPREIRIKLSDEARSMWRKQVAKQSVPEKGNDVPHILRIKKIMRDMAKGRIPAGFSMRTPESGDAIHCFQPGLQVRTGQVMDGPGMTMRVAVVRNTATVEIELNEAGCRAAEKTVAVAAWPHDRLEPGESTELYVLSRERETPPESIRPSLLGGS